MYDKKRIPIYIGDLLKIKKQDGSVEYNLVGEKKIKPFGTFYTFLTLNLDGSSIDLQDEGQIFDNIEIIQGYGDRIVGDYRTRSKIKKPKQG